jgi:transposase
MKYITITPHHTQEELEQELKKTNDGRYRLRIHVILLAMQQYNSASIRKQLMVGRPTIFNWVRRYNQKGLKGIKEVYKTGRSEGNPKWDNSIFEALCAKLDLMEEFWSVPKMREWIKERYKVEIPERTIHYRLKMNGYTFKSSRPNPYKGDPALQAAFKKTV